MAKSSAKQAMSSKMPMPVKMHKDMETGEKMMPMKMKMPKGKKGGY